MNNKKIENKVKEILKREEINLIDAFILSTYSKNNNIDLSDQIINKCSTVVYNAYKNQISKEKINFFQKSIDTKNHSVV